MRDLCCFCVACFWIFVLFLIPFETEVEVRRRALLLGPLSGCITIILTEGELGGFGLYVVVGWDGWVGLGFLMDTKEFLNFFLVSVCFK